MLLVKAKKDIISYTDESKRLKSRLIKNTIIVMILISLPSSDDVHLYEYVSDIESWYCARINWTPPKPKHTAGTQANGPQCCT